MTSAEKYILVGTKNVCRGQGTEGSIVTAGKQAGRGKGMKGNQEGWRDKVQGASAFEAEKPQGGREKERKGEKKPGGQGTGGSTFEAEHRRGEGMKR